MAWVAIAAAAIQAVGAVQQGQAAKAAANYNAAVAERNATVARDQAAADEAVKRREVARTLGAMRAGYAASGIRIEEGSPLDVLSSSVAEGEFDAQRIRYQGELKALGYIGDAGLERAKGSNASRQGYYNAGSALLLGAAKYQEAAGAGKTGSALTTG